MTSGTIIRSIGSLTFDAVFEESHESDLEVTEFPIETGSMISDHAYMKPLRITIQAGVSDTPLRTLPNDIYASDAGRARKAFDLLTQLQLIAEPFTVQTGLKLYKNMVCTSLRSSQDKNSSCAFYFTATLREVVIVSTETVTYPPRKKGATARQSSAKKKNGEQQTTTVTSKSLAAKLLSTLKG